MDPIVQTPSAAPDRTEKAPPTVPLPDGSRLSAPVPRTPDHLRVGQWVAVGRKPRRIDDLHKTPQGGRLVILHGRPAVNLAAGDTLAVYTVHSPPIRGVGQRPDIA